MQNSDFEGPPLHWSLVSIVGGISTAVLLIAGLELSAERFVPLRAELVDKTTETTTQIRTQSTD
ncbi:MAG: hypothetical protein AAFV85_16770 [Cyanobacteria bacterium J06634_6]